MRWSPLVLIVALIASVALNLLLSVRGTPARASRAAEGPCLEQPQRADRRALPRFRPTPSGLRPVDTCAESLMVEQVKLRSLAADLRAHAPLQQLFAEGEPQPDRVEQLTTLIRKTVAGNGGVPPSFQLECRSDVCRLDHGGGLGWQILRQGWFRQITYGELVQHERQAFFRLRGTAVTDGYDILRELVRDFRASGVEASCAARHPDDHGALEVLLAVRTPKPGAEALIEPYFGGSVASAPGGRCLEDALRGAIERLSLPADVGEASATAYLFLGDGPRR
jgi:hypothetical protein